MRYNYIRKGGRSLKTRNRKEIKMKKMTQAEMLRLLAEENQTRKILEIVKSCKDLKEAEEKIKALLNK
jgi:protein phosphatase 1 regulatory subunit 14A